MGTEPPHSAINTLADICRLYNNTHLKIGVLSPVLTETCILHAHLRKQPGKETEKSCWQPGPERCPGKSGCVLDPVSTGDSVTSETLRYKHPCSRQHIPPLVLLPALQEKQPTTPAKSKQTSVYTKRPFFYHYNTVQFQRNMEIRRCRESRAPGWIGPGTIRDACSQGDKKHNKPSFPVSGLTCSQTMWTICRK